MFNITINEFDGPLDLMLYLIKENKLDLFDLDLLELANQYIAYIHQMKSHYLEVASEYLVELAGLIEYKSKRLLPRDESQYDAEDPEEEQLNLVERLIEYQKYKEITELLNTRYLDRQQQYAKMTSTALFKEQRDDQHPTALVEGDVYDLIKAMEKVMIRYTYAHPKESTYQIKEIAVDDCIDEVRAYLRRHRERFGLDALFAKAVSRQHLIVTFLAVLDMIRMQEIRYMLIEDTVYLKGSESYE